MTPLLCRVSVRFEMLCIENHVQLGLVVHAYNLSTQKWRQEDCEFETSLGYVVREILFQGKKILAQGLAYSKCIVSAG